MIQCLNLKLTQKKNNCFNKQKLMMICFNLHKFLIINKFHYKNQYPSFHKEEKNNYSQNYKKSN